VVALFLAAALSADEREPLRARIDRAVDSSPIAPAAPPADDAAFLRRVALDLTGRIPPAEEARGFLADRSADKRARLVDRLLASPEFPRHMAVVIDLWLMERRPDRHVKTDEWRAWLAAFVASGRPFTELARDVLGADGSEPLLRPAARFMLDREVSPDALTRDVGRAFFGIDLECAQCHDHPRIDDYVQRDYYGLYAFVNRLYLFQPDGKKPAVVAEKGEGDVSFKSVFTKAEGNARPRLPDGGTMDEPAFAKGEEYLVKADPKDKSIRPIPKFSRRQQLAKLLGEGAGRSFDRNLANRLWAHMMGRGLVEPLDLHHSDNPPVHPGLLELLTSEVAALKYDVRGFLRELALTRTYQRSIEVPASAIEPARSAAAKLPALEAEAKRLKASAEQEEEAFRKAADAHGEARKAAAAAAAEQAKAETAAAEARKLRDAAQKELDAREALRKAVGEAAEKASDARLAGDPDLAQAAGVFRARGEKLGAETASLAKDAAAKKAILEASDAEAAAAKARRSEREVRAAALAGELPKAEARRRAEKAASVSAARLAADAATLSEYAALHSAAERSREAVRQVQAELAVAREALAKGPGELPALEARAAEARKAVEEARKALAPKADALRAAADAAAKAEEVARQAAKDAELLAAAAKVKERKERLAAEAASLQAALAKAEAELARAEKARTDLADAPRRVPSLEAALKAAAVQDAADQSRRAESFAKVSSLWTQRFAVGGLDPLSPEQICWGMMQATGLVDAQRAAARAEAAKKNVPEAEAARFVEQFVHDKLKGNEAAFVRTFGGAPGQPQDEFYATVDQALFLSNGALVRGWLAPAAGNLTDRLMRIQDPKALAEELYLAVLTRRPSEAEVQDVTRHLGARSKSRLAAVQEMAWATLTSVEFRFKH
jgi:hypothetical protein